MENTENSFELYTKYLRETRTRQRSPEQKFRKLNDVAKIVYSELTVPPFEFQNSPFVVAVNEIIETLQAAADENFPAHWKDKSIVIIDALVVARAVRAAFANRNYNMLDDGEIFSDAENFFADAVYPNEKNFVADIQKILSDVSATLRDIQTRHGTSEPAPEKITFQAEVDDDQILNLG